MSVLDGATTIDKYYITPPDDLYNLEEQIQPNGVDLRIHRAFQVAGKAVLPADSKMNFDDMQVSELEPKDGYFQFKPGQGNYLIDFRETVSVPENYCGIIVPRSSMLRAGAFMTSALWDAGYRGRAGGSLRVLNPIDIQYGARLAQMLFIKAEYNGMTYIGRYQDGDSQVGF